MAKKKQKLNKNRIAEIRKKQAQQVKEIGTKPTKTQHPITTVFDAKTGMETVTTKFYKGKARKRTTTRDVVIYKDGKIVNEKAFKALEDAANKGEDRGLIFSQHVRKLKSGKTHGSVTARHLLSTMIKDDIARMLFNQNKPLDIIAAEAGGASEQELLDPSNWNGSIFTNPKTHVKYQFVFRYNYDGSSNWTRV